MLHRSCPVKVKAVGDSDGLGAGVFEAVVSVFGNRDSYGDVVVKGAFADTLAEWESKGDPIPVYWSHRMDDPDFNIGHVLEASETDQGLQVKAQLDLDSPKAAQVYRLLKGRRVTQFSFAYDVLDAEYVTRDGQEVYELRKLKVYEVGPTPIGANQETELLAVKAAGEHARNLVEHMKAGRVLSAKNETALRSAREQLAEATKGLDDVLSALGGEANDDQGKARTAGPAKDEEPSRAKSEEPSRMVPASTLAVLSLLELEGSSL